MGVDSACRDTLILVDQVGRDIDAGLDVAKSTVGSNARQD